MDDEVEEVLNRIALAAYDYKALADELGRALEKAHTMLLQTDWRTEDVMVQLRTALEKYHAQGQRG